MNLQQINTIVVEDQPVIWDFINDCFRLSNHNINVIEYCSNTFEAEKAIRKYKPDLLWLDCYLGEFCEINHGLKNSGLEIAKWTKAHSPQTKIMLFTASFEKNIQLQSQQLNLEGIMLGGKYLKNKDIIVNAINRIITGYQVKYPPAETDEAKPGMNLTLLEFCVVASLILGKSTAKIAEELSSTRKQINNTLYRVREKLNICENLNREELLETVREIIFVQDNKELRSYLKLNDVASMEYMSNSLISPVIDALKTNNFTKQKIEKLLHK